MKLKIVEEVTPDIMYHVTKTEFLPTIKKEGILPMGGKRLQSNWVHQGDPNKQYGQGEVYAFDNMNDAARWAASWDWDLTQNIGSGEVSIIKFRNKDKDWGVDESDPIRQLSSKGKWWKKFVRIRPEDIIGVVPFTGEMAKKLAAWGTDIGDIFA